MAGEEQNEGKDQRTSTLGWLWATKTRQRLAVASIILTIAGIYLNGSINFTQLLSSRARAAADALQGLNVAYGQSVAATGKQCLNFALEEFAGLSSTEAAERIRMMWDDNGSVVDGKDFSNVSAAARPWLVQCLVGGTYVLPADVTPFVPKAGPDEKADPIVAAARRHIRKQIFGYLNLHETVFDLVRVMKVDSRMVCNQIGSEFTASPAGKFVIEVLEKHLVTEDKNKVVRKGRQAVQDGYPGLAWFVNADGYCGKKGALWFENVVEPILPLFSTRE